MFVRILCTFSLLAILLAGCQNPLNQATPIPTSPADGQSSTSPTLEPFTFRTSKPGMVTLHGNLLVTDPENGMPAANNSIYLVPLPADQTVISIPPIQFGQSPQADVDERTGEFVFTDIQPGKYIVVIVTIYDGQIPARTEDGNLAVVNVKEADIDQTIELNYLTVP